MDIVVPESGKRELIGLDAEAAGKYTPCFSENHIFKALFDNVVEFQDTMIRKINDYALCMITAIDPALQAGANTSGIGVVTILIAHKALANFTSSSCSNWWEPLTLDRLCYIIMGVDHVVIPLESAPFIENIHIDVTVEQLVQIYISLPVLHKLKHYVTVEKNAGSAIPGAIARDLTGRLKGRLQEIHHKDLVDRMNTQSFQNVSEISASEKNVATLESFFF